MRQGKKRIDRSQGSNDLVMILSPEAEQWRRVEPTTILFFTFSSVFIILHEIFNTIITPNSSLQEDFLHTKYLTRL